MGAGIAGAFHTMRPHGGRKPSAQGGRVSPVREGRPARRNGRDNNHPAIRAEGHVRQGQQNRRHLSKWRRQKSPECFSLSLSPPANDVTDSQSAAGWGGGGGHRHNTAGARFPKPFRVPPPGREQENTCVHCRNKNEEC